ncbi:MAG: NUDIX hydrolase [Sphingomonas sp.]
MAEDEAVPAATVIVMRPAPPGPPELLMVERAAAMRFAGGMLVFPGGRVDPGDRALAALLPGDPDDMAARIAAIRETIEEAGVPVGLDPGRAAIAALRDALYAGEPMGALLEAAGEALDPHALIPFARWLPRGLHGRIFDTRFYLALAPAGAEPVVDGNENVRAFWASARAVLDASEAGEAAVIFPTRRNLERLALYASFEEAAAHARAHPVRTVTPWVEQRVDGEYLCIPEGLGYPVTAEPLRTATRA